MNRLEPDPIAALPWSDGGPLRDLSFSPDGTHLVAVAGKSIVVWSAATGRVEWQQAATIGPGDVDTVFAPDDRHALIVANDAEGAAQHLELWRIDLAQQSVTQAAFGRVRDAAAVGARLVVLAEADGALSAIDAVSGQTLWKTAAGAPVQGARLVERRGSDSGRVAAAPNPLLSLGAAAPFPADIVVVDAAGHVQLSRLDEPKSAKAPPLPAGARVLAIGKTGRVIGVRLADGRQAVLDALSGRELWRSAAPVDTGLAFAGGDRFVATRGERGLLLQGLDGSAAVEVEHARHSDWDLAGLTNVQRYSAIIDVDVSADGETLATAWKDGRVDVWRAGLKARYGAIDGVPRPNFESVARFDHGEALGATVTWVAPAAVRLSPSGRFVASQSMGLETNAAGGVIAHHPKLRLWDTRTGGEIARFQRGSDMLIKFSPRDDLAVTMTVTKAEQPVFELWRLGAPATQVQRERVAVALPATSAAASPASQAAGAAAGMARQQMADLLTTQVNSSDLVWVGADRRLRMLDARQRRIAVLEDLTQAIAEEEARTTAAAERLASHHGPELPDAAKGMLQSAASTADAFAAGVPELPLPVFPIAVSPDGLHAAVKIGTQLRVYGLDRQQRVIKVDSGRRG
ncbi:MAG: WD40 repeat domain-containing protein [Nevskiaceae bacterium]